MKRQPASLWPPNDPLPLITAGRNARSAALLVGSTPCCRANVPSAGSRFITSAPVVAVLAQLLSLPNSSHVRTRGRHSASIHAANFLRDSSPLRTRCQRSHSLSLHAVGGDQGDDVCYAPRGQAKALVALV